MSIFAAVAISTAVAIQPVNPRSMELFEREPALLEWALQQFDLDGDGRLSPVEAQAAANEFRRLADGNGDGRVTPYEYARAVEFIVARYAVGFPTSQPRAWR